jgi:peptide/nickel transport system permease protein
MTVGVRIALGWLVLIVCCALFAQWIPFIKDPNFLYGFWEGAPRSAGPSTEFWLGTDASSRDVLSRLIWGARISTIIALISVGSGFVIGGFIGSYVGFVRGRREALVMAVLDVVLAFPPLVLVLVMVTITRQRNLLVVSGLLGLAAIPAYARLARANALVISKRDHVTAARAIGTPPGKILRREIIPNVVPPLVAYSLSAAAFFVALESSLAFIGFGVASRLPSWGRMILLARVDIRITVLPMVYPAMTLVFTIWSLNIVGDWMRQRSNIRAAAI